MNVERAVEEPRAGATGAILFHRSSGGFLDAGMIG